MGWIAIAFICVLVILIIVFRRLRRKDGEKARHKSTEGRRDLSDTRLEPVEVVHTKDARSYIPEESKDKDERSKRERLSKKAASYGRSEITRTHGRYDLDRRWKESVRTLFPDEWSPALPYLYEANRLEREGADQEKIQKVLDQARKADSAATSFYIARWSIIKEMRNQSHK